MATDRPGRYSNCQSKRKTPADVLTSSSRPPAPSRRAGPVARATADSVPSFPSPPPSPTNHPTPSGHVKDKFGAQARYECQRRARDSLGGGERRGTAGPREGEGGGRGARRRPACAPAPRASRPRPATRRGEGAGLCGRAGTQEAHSGAPALGTLTCIPGDRAGSARPRV